MKAETSPSPSLQAPSLQVEKAAQVIAALLKNGRNNEENRLKLSKLVWAADRYSIRSQGALVTQSPYSAMFYGPVPSIPLTMMRDSSEYLPPADIAYAREHFDKTEHGIILIADPGDDLLSPLDEKWINKAESNFRGMDRWKLATEVSHRYPEWKKFADFFAQPENRKSRRQIDETDFFYNPDGHDRYFALPPEQLAMAKELYDYQKSILGDLGVLV
ncbi:type II toxin-antitoxin system antitoxin SocA domain-containing protein [Corynebacterium phocae]|nr:type II toxin-antitoxin system antitoxin SocA domain-containing protein [Corynebacterium phocae]